MHDARITSDPSAYASALAVTQPTANVMQGLNLFLPLKSPAQMPALLATVGAQMTVVRQALGGLHYVHFARFLPTPDGSMLLVITEFDGDLRSYIMDFVAVMGDVFTAILEFVAGAPPLPVQAYPNEFWQFIQKHNIEQAQPWSAYGRSTVIDILGTRRSLPPAPAASTAPTPAVDLGDVQANILRGFRAEHARHFALSFTDAAQGRKFLSSLIDEHSPGPKITSGGAWAVRPKICLNIGFTCAGLGALGVPAATLQQFPEAYREGPAVRAAQMGDTGESAPANWTLGGPNTSVHALLSLFGGPGHLAVFDAASLQLTQAFASFGVTLVSTHDAAALPEGGVHFGYRDSIGQPHIAGVPTSRDPDLQPQSSAGEFLLGQDYINQYGGNFINDLPEALANNATYAAVRVLEQDTAAFESLLSDVAVKFNVDREWVAAKLMGRWRNGEPLTLSPEAPRNTMALNHLNHFDFGPSADNSAYFDDFDGTRCPVGAHIRRLNPRNALVTGKPHSRRLIRRGMAYGPKYQPGAPDVATPRGLFGLFICGDLEMQYEFMLNVWANQNIATSGQVLASDPILSATGSTFTIPVVGRSQPISFYVPKLVTTRGAVYTLMPGLAGLRYLASGAATGSVA
jgi:deferrochelatase/peroxidase EfeB